MKPFLKWVGGKTQLLPALLSHVPKSFGAYHEPFLGGGALFFALQPKQAYLSDINLDLINTYRGVRNDCATVVIDLQRLAAQHADEEYYYLLRTEFNRHPTPARFIYLNKTCFNGLYRVNKSGDFNVPRGKYKNPNICDAETLLECSEALRNATLTCTPFQTIRPAEGDFWYADPPYVPLNATSDFTAYDKTGFDKMDQIRLRDFALKLKRRGVHVMLSNSDTPFVREIYKDFEIHTVEARRNVNSKGSKRGKVSEVIIK